MGTHGSSSGDEFILEKHELQQQCYEGKKREEKLKQYTSTRTSPPPSFSSSTSSPSHEFSFTISLHRPPSFAIDLSPADDIFFHGHLLPLHLISHCSSISPRSSTTSYDTVGLPIRELLDVDVKKKLPSSTSNIAPSARGSGSPVCVARVRSKPKYSFSLFRKWRRPSKSTAGDRQKEEEERKKKKKNGRFDVGRVLRRYVRVVRPLFLFGGEKEDKSIDLRWRPHSFSGNYSISRLKEWGERRRRSSGGGGQFSAPASMRTSPTNSGLLVATATISSSNDSTMEELQSAIQAAIAHCKNSINAAKEDNVCRL